MQQCEDCKQAHLNPLLICPKHGHFLHLPKPLTASLSKDKHANSFPTQFPLENYDDDDLDNDDLDGIEEASELPGEEQKKKKKRRKNKKKKKKNQLVNGA